VVGAESDWVLPGHDVPGEQDRKRGRIREHGPSTMKRAIKEKERRQFRKWRQVRGCH